MAEIFVSYRRDDTGMLCERVTSRLGARFGARRVFRDTNAIYVGSAWEQTLLAALQDCYVVIALIGPDWLGARDTQGRQRLFDPHDFVWLELASALAQRKRVIPILAPGARMPQAHELPPDLAPLAQLPPLPLRPDPYFDGDMQALIQAVAPGVQRRIPHLAVALYGVAGLLSILPATLFSVTQPGYGAVILYIFGALLTVTAWLLIVLRSLNARAWVWLALTTPVGAPLLVGTVGFVWLGFVAQGDAMAANVILLAAVGQLLTVILALAFGFGGPRSLSRFQNDQQARWTPPARASRWIVGVCATATGLVLCVMVLSGSSTPQSRMRCFWSSRCSARRRHWPGWDWRWSAASGGDAGGWRSGWQLSPRSSW